MRSLSERVLLFENWFPVEILNDDEREKWEEKMI
jgi:hypothetical protein